MLVLSGRSGRVRTSNVLRAEASVLPGETSQAGTNVVIQEAGEPITLNVDAVATAQRGDRVEVQLTFEYRPAPQAPPAGQRGMRPATLNESLHIMLKTGQPLVVSQSADPATDRKVTVELTATVLK
jgi:hypothetical protein